jgi:hypothetical protein
MLQTGEREPEKWRPGRLDARGASGRNWHAGSAARSRISESGHPRGQRPSALRRVARSASAKSCSYHELFLSTQTRMSSAQVSSATTAMACPLGNNSRAFPI